MTAENTLVLLISLSRQTVAVIPSPRHPPPWQLLSLSNRNISVFCCPLLANPPLLQPASEDNRYWSWSHISASCKASHYQKTANTLLVLNTMERQREVMRKAISGGKEGWRYGERKIRTKHAHCSTGETRSSFIKKQQIPSFFFFLFLKPWLVI